MFKQGRSCLQHLQLQSLTQSTRLRGGAVFVQLVSDAAARRGGGGRPARRPRAAAGEGIPQGDSAFMFKM